MLDLAETPDGNVLLAAPTDRTVSIFDLRVSSRLCPSHYPQAS
jgi:ribosome biogenesis protein YTM1